ncbi:jg13241 [Pararge aegeria aegeria]|uniref:Jg13241 protein n=1 Tax=Pararge aegeria aegeria TaxID=348720 RepID=A0A8S4RC53_9NEOP|nr:jg13241 [Pararge aegeria aegeria]
MHGDFINHSVMMGGIDLAGLGIEPTALDAESRVAAHCGILDDTTAGSDMRYRMLEHLVFCGIPDPTAQRHLQQQIKM